MSWAGEASWRLLGETLLQSVWQGAAVALLTALFLRALRRRDPRERYAVACLALVALALLPVGTYLWLAAQHHVHAPSLRAATATGTGPASTPAPGAFEWVAWAWLAGVLSLQARLVFGYGQLARMKRRDTLPVDERWQAMLRELSERLGLRRAARLAVSTRVSVPSLVGWLEPVVLVPVGALNALTPAEVRAVLAHELAHLKRLDPLIGGPPASQPTAARPRTLVHLHRNPRLATAGPARQERDQKPFRPQFERVAD